MVVGYYQNPVLDFAFLFAVRQFEGLDDSFTVVVFHLSNRVDGSASMCVQLVVNWHESCCVKHARVPVSLGIG